MELALKDMLRALGLDPPRWCDVEAVLQKAAHQYPPGVQEAIPDHTQASHRLRREWEFALYGDSDCIPTIKYNQEDPQKALEEAQWT